MTLNFSEVDRVAPNAIFTPTTFLRRHFSRVLTALALVAGATVASATPTISITSPASGSTIASVTTPAGTTITATATATALASISSVQFFDNGASIGTVGGTSPFSITWIPTTAGSHTLTATVTDNSVPTTGTSPSVNTATATSIVTLTTVRTVTIASPAASSSFAQNSGIFLRSSPVMSDAVIASVQFKVDGTNLGSPITSSPYNAAVILSAANGFSVGAHTLTAVATNGDGSITVTSPGVTVNIAAAVGTAPTISLTTSAVGGLAPLNQNVTLTATASDADGFIPSTAGGGVTFYVDGDPVTPVGTGETNPRLVAPYTLTWKPTVAKTYSLRAQTTDDKNNTVLSSVVSITATAATVAPTVTLTSPTSGATLSVGSATTLAATATANGGATVTKVDFLSGSTVLGTATTSPYTFSWTPTTAGAVSLTARVTDSNGTVVTSAAVSATVSTSAPSISITAPLNGASVALNASTTITASATANGGATVSRVDFLAGTTTIGTALTAPYSITWTPTAGGITALTAKVTDSAGTVVTSSIVNVSVTVPTVALTNPASGASASVGTPVALAATASAISPATVAKVEFFAGSTLVDTALAAPYTGVWTPTATGTVSLTAKVTDSNGAAVTSSAVSVTVASAAGPGVSLVTPVTGAIVTVGSGVTVTAAPTAGAGATVVQVQFLVGTTVIGTVNSSPYSVTWTPPSAGNFSITARVLDSSNASATSGAVAVTAVNASTVSLTSPAANATVSTGSPTTVSASATASAGATITQVAFFANGVAIGSPVTSAPYTVAWTPAAAGTVLLTARATDSLGVSVTSTAASVTVVDPSLPVIALTVSPGVTTLPAGATRYALATVTPSAGRAITRVEFFVDGVKVGEKTSAPYAYKYTAPATVGSSILLARATDNAGATRDAQLTLSVVSAVGAPPTVTLLAPGNNAVVVPNVAVPLAATASAPGGTIASVQFFQNGVVIGAPATASPFIGNFTPTAPGSYTLEAIATDDRGNTAVSSTVNITAAFGPPTVSLTAPRSGVRLTPAVPVTLTATAAGGSGSPVTTVEFLLDGAQLGIRTAPTAVGGTNYSFSWTPDASQLGAHQLSARVTDANSSSVTSAAVSVTVAALVGVPPTIQILAPTPGSTLQSLSTVTFLANNVLASGSQSSGQPNTITSVEFFLNDLSVGLGTRQGTSNTYRATYNLSPSDLSAITPDANGRYPVTLYAIARDTNGNQTLTAVSNLFIIPSTSLPPAFGQPGIVATNTNVIAGTTIQLFALNVTDSDGTVASLQYFANGLAVSPVPSTFAPNFPVTFTPNAAGTYTVYGVATDDTGNTAVSNAITITVTGNNAPVVALIRPADSATVTNINAPVFLEATASDPDAGQTINVVFLNGNTPLAAGQRVGTTTTYRAVWIPTVANTYTVTARATDSANAQTTSAASRTVVVNNIVGLPPAITINVPGSVTTNSSAIFTANATDSDGIVTSVEFFVNRSSIGQAVRDQTGSLWRIATSFGALPIGAAEVVAIATDNTGNLAASPTGSVNITASTSAAPTINIAADKTTVAFSQPVQLSANAFDADGTVTSVQYFANGLSVGTSTTAPSYLVSWTASASGTYSVYAVATDNTGNTTVANPLAVTVKRNNPILDDDAFILQTFQDILTKNPNPIELSNYSAQLAAGSVTRAQLAATLAADPAFNNTANLCAAYYLLMNEWPTYTNYQTLFASRGNLGTVVGQILGSSEYLFKYGTTTAATLNASYTNAYTPFAARLWQNSMGRAPSALELVRFHDNDTALPTLGRGYTVVGLNTAIAEFITRTNSGNTAFQNLARSAALYYQLLKAQPTAAQVASLAALPDTTAIATSILGSSLYTYRYVTITSHPVSLSVAAKSGALFRVEAVGQPPLAYQWLFNGAPIAGATTPLLSVTNIDSTKTGNYAVVVTSAVASTTSDPALLTLSGAPTRLGNISTRGVAGTGANVLTAGFVITGTATKQMLIRVIGPSLGSLGITGFLADPRLDLLNSAGVSVQTNDNWGTQTGGAPALAAIQQATARLGAFALPNNSLDAVVLATLNPGSYTVQARGAGTTTGVALIEVYDASAALNGPKAINVSTRGNVGSGENILIAGFVVNGTVSRRMLIRGIGPTLRNFGLPSNSVLPDPQLKLLDAAGKLIASNDDWATGEEGAIIAAAATAAGAFPLANGSKDSSIIIMLAPGAYTAQLSGVGTTNNTGIALVEVYDIDP